MVASCQAAAARGDKPGRARRWHDCLVKQLGHKDWRVRERAALELQRSAPGGGPGVSRVVTTLASAYAGEVHDQVKQAILIGLEQLALRSAVPAKLADRLAAVPPERKRQGGQAPPAALRSRVICLAESLRRNQKGHR